MANYSRERIDALGSVYDQIKEPSTKDFLIKYIPYDRKLPFRLHYIGSTYDERVEGLSLPSKFGVMAALEGANIYRYILGIATTPLSDDQLYNTFGALVSIQHYTRPGSVHNKPGNIWRREFLQGYKTAPDGVSTGAQAIHASMSDIYEVYKDKFSPAAAELLVLQAFRRDYSYQDANIRGQAYDDTAQFMLEAYIAALVDIRLPFPLREILINNPDVFCFTTPNGTDARYNVRSSIYQGTAHPGWVFPDVLGSSRPDQEAPQSPSNRRSPEPKVKTTNNDLETRLNQANARIEELTTAARVARERADQEALRLATLLLEEQGARMNAQIEVQRLRNSSPSGNEQALRATLEATQQAMREKLDLFDRCGGHPLKVLGIDLVAWRHAGEAKRASMLREAHAKEVKSKFYGIHESQPGYDPVRVQLTTERMRHLAEAKSYLERNLDKGII